MTPDFFAALSGTSFAAGARFACCIIHNKNEIAITAAYCALWSVFLRLCGEVWKITDCLLLLRELFCTELSGCLMFQLKIGLIVFGLLNVRGFCISVRERNFYGVIVKQ